MGRLYRLKRATEKAILRSVLVKLDDRVRTRFERIAPAPPISIKEARKILRDPGYRENEYGELRSTIRKLTAFEIVERASARAVFELQQQEDARVFAEMGRAIAALPSQLTTSGPAPA